MRRINNGSCPQVLANNEASEVAALDNMLANGQELVFNEKLYSHKDVKEALKKIDDIKKESKDIFETL